MGGSVAGAGGRRPILRSGRRELMRAARSEAHHRERGKITGVPAASLQRLRDLVRGPLSGAVVLGSGLGGLLDRWRPEARLALSALPGFPIASVPGHPGSVALARFEAGAAVLVFQGRVHFYEGYPRAAVTCAVRTAAALGARWLLLTNASGSCEETTTPGSVLVIEDHLRLLMGPTAARGAVPGPPRRGSPYDPRRTEAAFRILGETGLRTMRGTLYGGLGPNYETAAEVEMIRRLGAQAACMSTVVEAEEGARLGLEVAALSLVTNYCTGLARGPLDHAEVIDQGARVGPELARAIDRLVRHWCGAPRQGASATPPAPE
ncbi:MAG: purine-nucleoside phosphorylase [Candidatus Eisenbacteria bacterium]|nr:purine-nucleoside phosphorylase [Candidatus Eisenbacteria bacterium]